MASDFFLLLILAVGGAAAFFILQPAKAKQLFEGETRLLDYLGAQVVGIANAQLVPELSYQTIRYEPPYTLALGGVKLTALDGTEVLDLGSMTVTLAEVPKRGEPIKIASVKLTNGAVNLIRDTEAGGLRGLSPLVEPAPEREQAAEKPEFNLSNVLVLNNITIEGIDLVYDAGDGTEPMRLDALAANLDIVPATETGEGWYELNMSSGREPGLELDVDGQINISTFELALDKVTAETRLDDQSTTTLPPQLAALIEQYQLRGDLKAEVSGRIPLLEPERAELTVNATLADGRGVFGEYQIPLDSVTLAAGMSSGVIDLSTLQADTLGGTVGANGRVVLGGDASLEWNVAGLHLREMLAAGPTDQPPKMAGIITSNGRVRFPLASPVEGLSGAGDIDVAQGRLVNIPVISSLVKVMEVTGLMGSDVFRDTFKSPFTLSPEGVTLKDFDLRTPAIAARGSGTIGLQGSLDMSVNGGPVEALQNKLGGIGKILGMVTDGLVKYRIKGTVEEPKISVAPLGIGG